METTLNIRKNAPPPSIFHTPITITSTDIIYLPARVLLNVSRAAPANPVLVVSQKANLSCPTCPRFLSSTLHSRLSERRLFFRHPPPPHGLEKRDRRESSRRPDCDWVSERQPCLDEEPAAGSHTRAHTHTLTFTHRLSLDVSSHVLGGVAVIVLIIGGK